MVPVVASVVVLASVPVDETAQRPRDDPLQDLSDRLAALSSRRRAAAAVVVAAVVAVAVRFASLGASDEVTGVVDDVDGVTL